MIVARFQGDIAIITADLPTQIITNTNQYQEMIVLQRDSSCAALAQIPLRLLSLLCKEAVNQRSYGRITQVLPPFCMRMGDAAISASLILARHGGALPSPTGPQITEIESPADLRRRSNYPLLRIGSHPQRRVARQLSFSNQTHSLVFASDRVNSQYCRMVSIFQEK
jgi:hypothetical protein